MMLAVFVGFRGGWLQFAESTPRVERSVPPLLSIDAGEQEQTTESSTPQSEEALLNEYGPPGGLFSQPSSLMPGSKSVTGVVSTETVERALNFQTNHTVPPKTGVNIISHTKTVSKSDVGILDHGREGSLFNSIRPMIWSTPNSFDYDNLNSEAVISPEVISSKSAGVVLPAAVSRFMESSLYLNRDVQDYQPSIPLAP
ncbi:MAG: hypothetical protein Q8K78_12670 [Planctomycetaceae bacterium]|nr:hypothetical protein [Planctomycetaceae bacterium]